jgi:hypothetical protein
MSRHVVSVGVREPLAHHRLTVAFLPWAGTVVGHDDHQAAVTGAVNSLAAFG